LEGREGLLPLFSIKLALWTIAASFRSPFSFFQEKGAGGMSWFQQTHPFPLLEGREGLLPLFSIKLALWTFAAFFRSPFSFFQEKGAGGMSWF